MKENYTFWKSEYDTFEEDVKKDRLPLLYQNYVKENLSEIKYAYAFIKMIRDIFSLELVQLLKDYVKQFNFEPHE